MMDGNLIVARTTSSNKLTEKTFPEFSLERKRALVLCDLLGAFVNQFRCGMFDLAAWPDYLSFKHIIDYLFSRKLLSHRSLELLVYLVGHRQTYRSVDYYFTDDTESLTSSSVQRVVEQYICNWVSNVPPSLPLLCCGRAVSREFMQAIPPPSAYGLFPGERLCAVCGSSDNLKACSNCLETLYCGERCQRADYERHHSDCQPNLFEQRGGNTNTRVPPQESEPAGETTVTPKSPKKMKRRKRKRK